MGNSKIPAYGGGGCCGNVSVPVARVITAPTQSVDYMYLRNKPSIEGVTLEGNKDFIDFGYRIVTEEEVDALFDNILSE